MPLKFSAFIAGITLFSCVSAQTVTYEIPLTPAPNEGFINMRQNTMFEDFCASPSAEIKPNAGNLWGIQWMSTNTNTPVSVTVEFPFMITQATGSIPITLNGSTQTAWTPAFNNSCAVGIQSYSAFTLTDYNPNALNTMMIDYTGFPDHIIWGFSFTNPFIYAEVTVNYGGLPIELIQFNGEAKDDHVELYWQTATETDNDYFTIERSMDGKMWSDIIEVDGAGNSTELQSYKVQDLHPENGINYYRLRQTDFSGDSEVSSPVAVEFYRDIGFTVAPNPALDDLTIYLEENHHGVIVHIYNSMGELVGQENIPVGERTRQVDITDLPAGIYIVNISNGFDTLSNTITLK